MKTTASPICRLFAVLLLMVLHANAYCQCGTERWKIKTLADSEANQINFTPVASTVHQQLQLKKPVYHEINRRAATEKKVYTIKCILVKYMVEDDKDWHLVIQDLSTGEQMVVEIPDPGCIDKTKAAFSKIKISRTRLKAKVGPLTKTPRLPPAGTQLEITGVGFFDKSNHPPGFKGRELHPVLELKVL